MAPRTTRTEDPDHPPGRSDFSTRNPAGTRAEVNQPGDGIGGLEVEHICSAIQRRIASWEVMPITI
ncbi:hypothetical protein EP51_01535 [Rhodococcus opacus]|uniref:Uncharacterized protein n=1 Tax=Rhodococcus opacus TaxID=37919 RepID=A0A076EAT1_RHOOP|nr:hypothetical protein EP51_01535 [Rhodococcus opacus]